MRIVIAGGSGFLGHALSARLKTARHDVVVLTRQDKTRRNGSSGASLKGVRFAQWTPDGEAGDWTREIDGADGLVNLAGAGIADKRWTAARKRVLWDSRILSTRSLVNALRQATRRPAVLIQGSAAGYYGAFENGPTIDESSPPGSDFLAKLCVAWEAEAQPAASLGCRLVITRSSVVLSRTGGALPRMMLPFTLFAGGPIGSGRQVMSWIHINDWIEMVLWAIEKSSVAGPVNLAAPEPVPSVEFSRALGRAMHRPSWLPVPGFALRLIVGEMANDALLRGHRILPKRAQELGYVFRHPSVDEALASAVEEVEPVRR